VKKTHPKLPKKDKKRKKPNLEKLLLKVHRAKRVVSAIFERFPAS
jgi:hypothetical protein